MSNHLMGLSRARPSAFALNGHKKSRGQMEREDGYSASTPIKLRNQVIDEERLCGASIYSRPIGNHPSEWNQRIAQAADMLSETEFPLNLEVITLQLASDLAEIEYAVHRAAIHLTEHKCVGEENMPVASRVLQLRAQLFGFLHHHIFYSNASEISEAVRHNGVDLSGQTSSDQTTCFHPMPWVIAQINRLFDAFLLSFRFQNSQQIRPIELRLALTFDAAIRCCGRLSLVSGFRCELVRFEAGDLFDPDFMEVQSVDEIFVPHISGCITRISSCVHGCLVALFASGLFSTQGRKAGRHARFPEQHRGILLSNKAIVVLDKGVKAL